MRVGEGLRKEGEDGIRMDGSRISERKGAGGARRQDTSKFFSQ